MKARENLRQGETAFLDDLDAPVVRISNEDVPMPYAANLERAALINADKIVGGVRKLLGR